MTQSAPRFDPAKSKEEAERMKSGIDLRHVAAHFGFTVDSSASSANHTVMRKDAAKVIIGRSPKNGHWAWSDNTGHQGYVFDFLCEYAGMKYGDAKDFLRDFAPGVGVADLPAAPRVRTPEEKIAAAEAAREEWAALPSNSDVPAFLTKVRAIPENVIRSERFAGTWKKDSRHNAIFPYRDSKGQIIAVEKRNRATADGGRSFRLYSAGADIGVWRSNIRPNDSELVVCESPIDCMSHYAIHRELRNTAYIAIRNGVTRRQLEAIFSSLPDGMHITSAVDSDAAGNAYHSLIEEAAKRVGRPFGDGRPTSTDGGRDWNEVLASRAAAREAEVKARPPGPPRVAHLVDSKAPFVAGEAREAARLRQEEQRRQAQAAQTEQARRAADRPGPAPG
ncbi:DUF3991 and TOPRIM domain-containing protein [Nitrospirillum sp. BR 11752]|uniref:DUF3991 and TOPRIM domain-containing protein n=1 Tax=Nitrospirillum sp. BR 11752 TaxID=3104293 RepID=UPI002EB6812A|nr:DUF3991 and TOPRIM domain-containing protein [Nitrospirillum sp. BR 11752]